MGFTTSESTFGRLPVLVIEGEATRVVVALRGVTVLSWTVDGVELIDGYADEQEFTDQAGMRSAMMIPFSNRIRGGVYSWEGSEIDFHAGDPEHAGETVLHGLLRIADFAITGLEHSGSFAIVHFASRALRPGVNPGYPFSVDVTIDLTVTATGLEFIVAGTNVGKEAAPFASGWHPYFTIGAVPIADLVVTIPAHTRVVVDDDLIPLDAATATEQVSDGWDFRAPRPLGDTVLDVAFGDLSVGPDGLAHSTMTDPKSGRTIDVWQDRGLMHVFTADTVTRPRASFAMESVEVMTNSVNRADQAAALRLEPGQRRTFRFGVTTTLERS